MSMFEPLLPHPDSDDERSSAAEPGTSADGAVVEPSPEPDVLDGSETADEPLSLDQDDESPEVAIDELVAHREEASFRTPEPGQHLTPDQLEARDPGA